MVTLHPYALLLACNEQQREEADGEHDVFDGHTREILSLTTTGLVNEFDSDDINRCHVLTLEDQRTFEIDVRFENQSHVLSLFDQCDNVRSGNYRLTRGYCDCHV